MSLRSRIAIAVKPLVREHAPQCLIDLWGREQVMVAVPSLEFSRAGKKYLSAEGRVKIQFIAERPDMLPNESLWQALDSVAVPTTENESRIIYLKLSTVTEYIDMNLWIQDVEFNVKFDLEEC